MRAKGADLAWLGTATSTAASSLTSGASFIEGYYIVGLLAQAMLRKAPGARIIHDPRLVVEHRSKSSRQMGGVPVLSKTGHAFIKERMRAEDAVYGGEMSRAPLLPRLSLLRQRDDPVAPRRGQLFSGREAPLPSSSRSAWSAIP